MIYYNIVLQHEYNENLIMYLEENLSIHHKAPKISGSKAFWVSKYFFDVILSLLMLPILIFFTIILFVVNSIFKLGPVFLSSE